MTDAGYTLTEMLVALMIVGLTVTGLTTAYAVIGRIHSDTHTLSFLLGSARSSDRILRELFQRQGPFRNFEAETFVGEATTIRFDCNRKWKCSADIATDSPRPRLLTLDDQGRRRQVRLPENSSWSFRYIGTRGALDAWPPSPDPTGRRSFLTAVNLIRTRSAGVEVFSEAVLWREQPPVCQFDAISQDCR